MVPLKLLQILFLQLLASGTISYVNFKFIYAGIKSGVYELPLFGSFDVWWKFVIAAWFLNAPFYVVVTLLSVISYRISLDGFGGVYTAFIISNVCAIMLSVLFIRLLLREAPNRNGWIAIALVLVSLFFAAYSGKES